MSEKGLKHDSTKPDYSLLDYTFIEDLIRVLTHGATIYGRNNWQNFTPEDIPRFASAIMRHTAAILKGEHTDPDSHLLHAVHIAAEAMFIHYHTLKSQLPPAWQKPTSNQNKRRPPSMTTASQVLYEEYMYTTTEDNR